MSDFILEYDILESIAKYSKSLGKRSEEYAEELESKIINAIGNVTGPSSGCLTSASDSVRDKINALKQKSEAFYRFAEQILNLLEYYHQYQVVGDFTKIKDYVGSCTDVKLKSEIETTVRKYYKGDYSRLFTYQGEIASVDGWGTGGGIQYEFSLTFDQLERLGLLKEIK